METFHVQLFFTNFVRLTHRFLVPFATNFQERLLVLSSNLNLLFVWVNERRHLILIATSAQQGSIKFPEPCPMFSLHTQHHITDSHRCLADLFHLL